MLNTKLKQSIFAISGLCLAIAWYIPDNNSVLFDGMPKVSEMKQELYKHYPVRVVNESVSYGCVETLKFITENNFTDGDYYCYSLYQNVPHRTEHQITGN